MNAIELKNITFKYENSEDTVLEDASMSINYGQIALLVGASGAGKSTVLSLISGIIPDVIPGKLSGNILIDGEDIAGKGISHICRKVGLVLQNAQSQIIYPTVEDEIAFGCENFAFDKKATDRAISAACQTMNLQRNWETRSLSGGQQQRLITASTLATGQKILILDEPLANLDVPATRLLMDTLRGLADQGYAVLIIEHRVNRVLSYTDTIWKLENKSIIYCDFLSGNERIIKSKAPVSVVTDLEIFKLEDITLAINGKNILNGINLSVNKGERVLLLGENGCGKTTLLRVLARLQKQSAGIIKQGIDPVFNKSKRTSAKWFSRVGVVYQNPDYQLFMPTVEQEVAFAAKDKEYASAILHRFGLADIAGRHPQSLSEGQKRRVTIAAVLASEPDVLLLDEPTVGQDINWLESMVEILNDIHAETGNTMITVTHDKRCAAALCDRAYVMENGIFTYSLNPAQVIQYLS